MADTPVEPGVRRANPSVSRRPVDAGGEINAHSTIAAIAPGNWSASLAVYLAAKAAEDAYDRDYYLPAYRRWAAAADEFGSGNVPPGDHIPAEFEAEIERLQNLRFDAEDALMVIPSPDGIAFARKFLIAYGDNRDANGWNDMLEAEAKRFVGEAVQ